MKRNRYVRFVFDLLSQGSLCTSRQLSMSRSQTTFVHTDGQGCRSSHNFIRVQYSRYSTHDTFGRRGLATDRSPVTTHRVIAYV